MNAMNGAQTITNLTRNRSTSRSTAGIHKNRNWSADRYSLQNSAVTVGLNHLSNNQRRSRSAPDDFRCVKRGRSSIKPLLGGQYKGRRPLLKSVHSKPFHSAQTQADGLTLGEIEFLRCKLGFTLPTAECVSKSCVFCRQPKGKLHELSHSAQRLQNHKDHEKFPSLCHVCIPPAEGSTTSSLDELTGVPSSRILLVHDKVKKSGNLCKDDFSRMVIWTAWAHRCRRPGRDTLVIFRTFGPKTASMSERKIDRRALQMKQSREREANNIYNVIKSLDSIAAPHLNKPMERIKILNPDGSVQIYTKQQLDSYDISDGKTLEAVKRRLKLDKRQAKQKKALERQQRQASFKRYSQPCSIVSSSVLNPAWI